MLSGIEFAQGVVKRLTDKFGQPEENNERLYWNVGSNELCCCVPCGFVKNTVNGVMTIIKFNSDTFESEFSELVQSVKM